MLQYEFMQRALIASAAIAVFSPVLGLFLILRRQSLMADTLSHISLAGVACGYLLGIDPTIATIVFVGLAALLLEYLRQVYANYSDISVAILMSGGMAVALLLLSRVESAASIDAYLFGSIVTISWFQVILLVILALLLITAYIIFRKPFYVLTFDEDTAHTAGLPTRLMSTLFSIVTGVAISVVMPIAGSLLVSAIMIMPTAIAMRSLKSFNTVILAAIAIGLVGMVGGLVTSYYFDTPPGATITCVFLSIFILQTILLRIKGR